MEVMRRVKDIDFERNEILIRDGKGARDKVTIFPVALAGLLQRHLQRVMAFHPTSRIVQVIQFSFLTALKNH